MTASPKVFTIGLDGGTFDLIDPWVKKGLLPNIKRLIEGGTRAVLTSVVLPFTPQAWGSFMTGMNPGSHGVFGFKEKARETYSFQFVNNRSIKSKTLWEYLTDCGKKSILVNIPMTYPPEPIDGIIIAGMDAPGVDSDFAYPPGMKEEVFETVKDYVIHLHVGAGYLDSDKKRRKAAAELIRMVACREKLVLHLMEKYPWDFFAVNFSAIDQVQHHFWQYLNGGNEFADVILNIYRRVDDAIGRLCEKMPPETTVYIMSDHGSGAASPYVIFIDEWLRQNGWLRFKRSFSARGVLTSSAKWVLNGLSRKLPSNAKDVLMRRFPGMRVKSQGYIRRALIDWENTKVYSGEHPATLRINLKGRDALGIVRPEDYEALRSELAKRLVSLKHPETGEGLVERVSRKEEIYYGDYLEWAPDLIIHPKEFAYQVKGGPYPSRYYSEVVSKKDPREFFVNGAHRLNGVFVAAGEGIKKRHELPALSIIDLFPAILYSLGLEIPESVHGRVAEAMFDAEFLAQHPVRFAKYPLRRGTKGVPGTEINYEEEDSKKIEESLKGLGYID